MTKRPKIRPDSVHLFAHEARAFAIRAPEGVTADDLRDPETWATVVGKFRKLDEVRVTDYGERWVCWGIVENVTPGRLQFKPLKVVEIEHDPRPIFSDPDYKIEWRGAGYGVVRKSDGLLMGEQLHSTEELAILYLARLRPRRSAA